MQFFSYIQLLTICCDARVERICILASQDVLLKTKVYLYMVSHKHTIVDT